MTGGAAHLVEASAGLDIGGVEPRGGIVDGVECHVRWGGGG